LLTFSCAHVQSVVQFVCDTMKLLGHLRFSGSSLKTGPARPGKTRPGSVKNLLQLIHMNLSNYFFITDSAVLISTTCSLLALYFMHEIREISDVRLRFMPEMSLDKRLTLNSTDISQWNYNSVTKLCLAMYRNCK